MFPAGLPVKSRFRDKPAAAGKPDKWIAHNPTQAEETEVCSLLDCPSSPDSVISLPLRASPTSRSPTSPLRQRRPRYVPCWTARQVQIP